VPLLPPGDAELLVRAVREGRDRAWADMVEGTAAALDGHGPATAATALVSLATALPSLRDRLAATFALAALGARGAPAAAGPGAAATPPPRGVLLARGYLKALARDSRLHMIQRTLAHQLGGEGGRDAASAMGALTSGEVEDAVSAMGASPAPAAAGRDGGAGRRGGGGPPSPLPGGAAATHVFPGAGAGGAGGPSVTLHPCLCRPAPPLMRPTAGEAVGLVSVACADALPLQLDPRAGREWGPDRELRRAMAGAVHGTLLPRAQATLARRLAEEPGALARSGLVPSRLAALVEHNPGGAVEVRRRGGEGGGGGEWLEEVVSGDLSLHALEVVNSLADAGALPPEALRRFVSNCIAQCGRADDKRQSRLVRLVCVFLRALIKTHAVDVEALSVEVQAFCIQFARHRDASALYQLLRGSRGEPAPS